MTKIIKLGLIFLLISGTLSCTGEGEIENSPEMQEYELLFSYGPGTDKYVKIAIINYFKLVALGAEYEASFPITQKWTSGMKIFVGGSPNDELLSELHLIKDEINSLVTDGFSIEIVNDSLKSNYYIFFGSGNNYVKKYPNQLKYIHDNWGLFSISANKNFEITSGHMYVDIERANFAEQKHILREELTQSLGFPNDIQYYITSIFYEGWSTTDNYSEFDVEIIRLLYHTKMVSGLNSSSAEGALKAILGIR